MNTSKKITRAEASLIKCLGQPVNQPDQVQVTIPKINYKPMIKAVAILFLVIVVIPGTITFAGNTFAKIQKNSAYSDYEEAYTERMEIQQQLPEIMGNEWAGATPRGTTSNDRMIPIERFDSVEQMQEMTEKEQSIKAQIDQSVSRYKEQEEVREKMYRESRIAQWVQIKQNLASTSLGGAFKTRLESRLADIESKMKDGEIEAAEKALANK